MFSAKKLPKTTNEKPRHIESKTRFCPCLKYPGIIARAHNGKIIRAIVWSFRPKILLLNPKAGMTASNTGMARQWTMQTEGPTTDKTLQKAAPRSLQLVLLSMMISTHGFDRLG